MFFRIFIYRKRFRLYKTLYTEDKGIPRPTGCQNIQIKINR